MTAWILLIITGYLLGSVPVSYLAARSRGIDLRKHGTRQVGSGNLWRMTSRKIGLAIGLFDLFKGMLMMWLAQLQGLDAGRQVVVGLSVMVGHNWPIFLRFHGGRGISTLLGIAIILPLINFNMISYWPSVIAIGITAVLTVILRSSPLPVLFASASLPLTNWLFGSAVSVDMAFLAIFLVVIIKRLTAQPPGEKLNVTTGQLLLNRFLFDRDIRDNKAWIGRRHKPSEENQ
jgi:glycerol-3-phosphate acyltransferase PlsY